MADGWRGWGDSEVLRWLEGLGGVVARHAAEIVASGVTCGQDLAEVDDDFLTDCGIKSSLSRKKALAQIASLTGMSSPAPAFTSKSESASESTQWKKKDRGETSLSSGAGAGSTKKAQAQDRGHQLPKGKK